MAGKSASANKVAPLSDRVVVLYGKYSGTEVTIEGQQLLILRESDILAIVN